MSSETTSKPRTTQLDTRRLVALSITVVIVVFCLGVVSSRGVASVLSAIGHGLESAADWLGRPLDNPAAYHSGEALRAYEQGDDPLLFSPADKQRL